MESNEDSSKLSKDVEATATRVSSLSLNTPATSEERRGSNAAARMEQADSPIGAARSSSARANANELPRRGKHRFLEKRAGSKLSFVEPPVTTHVSPEKPRPTTFPATAPDELRERLDASKLQAYTTIQMGGKEMRVAAAEFRFLYLLGTCPFLALNCIFIPILSFSSTAFSRPHLGPF